MPTLAIGDIHGNLRPLEDLLAKVLPTLRQTDTLVFLGDYIDRGPDSRGCLDRIIRLKKEAACTVVTLLGNHEEWMLRSLHDPTSHSWILGMEAFDTIASYSAAAAAHLRAKIERLGPRLITEKAPLPYEAFFGVMPPSHLAFLEQLEAFHETDDVVCAHGGVDLQGRPLREQEREVLIWGPAGFPDAYRGEQPVVYGHRDNAVENSAGWPWPCILDNRTFGIDTISKGVLTAMRFPDGKVFQSARFS